MAAICLSLFLVSLVLMQALVGGVRPAYQLTAYAILAVAAFLSPKLYRRNHVPPNVHCLIATTLFLGYLLVRSWLSPVEYLARRDAFMALGALMVYLLTALHITSPKRRWIIVGALVCLALINSFLGLLQFLKHGDVSLFGLLSPSEYGARACGLFVCPNHLAGFMEMTLLMTLSFVLWTRRRAGWKLAAGYIGLMGLGTLLLTGSRGGYVSAVFGLAVFATLSLLALGWTRHPRFRTVLGVTLLLMLFVAASVGYLVSQSAALQSRTFSIADSGHTRLELWRAAWSQFQLAPVFGTGSGTHLYFGRQFRAPAVQADPVHVHNDYLELLAEFGAVGILLLAVCLMVHLRSGWRAFQWFITVRGAKLGRLQGNSLALNIGALSALAALLIHSAMDFNLHMPANTMVAAFLLGLVANPGANLPFSEFNQSRTARLWLWAAPAAAGLFALAAVHQLPSEWLAERARIAYRDGHHSRAIDAARSGMAWDKRNPYLFRYLGQASRDLAEASADPAEAQRHRQDAVRAFQDGLDSFPQDVWTHLSLGEVLDELGRHTEANTAYLTAVALDSQSASVRAQYAFHLHGSGQWDEARKQYELSIQLHPTHLARAGLEQLEVDRASASERAPDTLHETRP